ncbi:MAG: hypothetical protein ABIA37_02960 [Candidatus Woesearchaeota archaeon]
MARKKRFLGIYLWIALVFGIIGLLDGLTSLFGFNLVLYEAIISILALLFFFFNIFAWAHFIQDRLEKITWVLPIYHLVGYVTFFIIGLVLSWKGMLSGGVTSSLSIISMLTSSFEILFSLYLLKKFELF